VEGVGTAVDDRRADAGGGATERVRVDVAEGEEADDDDVADEGADHIDVVDEGVERGVEPTTLPHPTASKATRANVAIFGYVTIGEPRITPRRSDRARGPVFCSVPVPADAAQHHQTTRTNKQ
jgi:hypothetical protein